MRRLVLGLLILSCEPPIRVVRTQVVVEAVKADAAGVSVTIRMDGCSAAYKRISTAASDRELFECLSKLTPGSTVEESDVIAGGGMSCGAGKAPNPTLAGCGLRGTAWRVERLGPGCP